MCLECLCGGTRSRGAPRVPGETRGLRAQAHRATALAPNARAFARAQAERAGNPLAQQQAPGLPTAVDNSTTSYFPPIGNQGQQGSCVAWASAYYYSTYTKALDGGYAASPGSTSVWCSPAFVYPLLNDGQDGGAVVMDAMNLLSVSGCSTWADTPWTASDYTTWPTETAWVNALRNRSGDTYYFDGSTSGSGGLDGLKQLLADGELAVIGLTVYQTWYDDETLADTTGISNGVYYMADGSNEGGHTLALVGYDDNKAYVDQRDGLTHYGAFLLANQWSPYWGTTNSIGARGYIWIAYSLFLDPSLKLWLGGDTSVYFNNDRPNLSAGPVRGDRDQLRPARASAPLRLRYRKLHLELEPRPGL